MTTPDLAPTDPDLTAEEHARDAAVRALIVAWEHRYPNTDPAGLIAGLITHAARVVDAHLEIGPVECTVLAVGNALDENRLATAVLATDPTHPGTPPTHRDLKAAAHVIQELTQV